MKAIIFSAMLISLGAFFSVSMTGCDGKDSKVKYQHPLHRTKDKE
jgi:hypothetical protein